jgi:exopolyphosphatase/guanosine-5'-triphosphate,3'-diphosphate pyrophosphatase
MSTRRLVIDIGTNSVLALLADVSDTQLSVILDKKKTTRLGEGLSSSGKLSQDAMRRTADAVIEFAKSASYDDLIMIGTEALRLARNSGEFQKMIRDSLGQEPIIISGRREAELSYLGARYNIDLKSDNILLIDVGGGSTELVNARGEAVENAISMPIGALKLKETAEELTLKICIEEAEKIIADAVSSVMINSQTVILATGGTITSAAAIRAGGDRFDAGRIHGAVLTVTEIRDIALRFERSDPARRVSLIPFDPERAELILPGLAIFMAIMDILGRESLIVSVGGIRFGAALYPDKLLT